MTRRATMCDQVHQRLTAKAAFGQSKHLDKIEGVSGDKIYSYETMKSYLKQSKGFAVWALKEHGIKKIDDARCLVDKYLEKGIEQGLASSTLKLQASALAKLYGCHTSDFCSLPQRKRADIVRSRGVKASDVNFSEKRNADLVAFCRATGLRRHELQALRRDNSLYKNENGYWCLKDIKGKGGRVRDVPIINPDRVLPLMDGTRGKVFASIPAHADIHSYRSDYATQYYDRIAHDPKTLPLVERYCCRDDLAGVWYDRGAMRQVSDALGHNRVSVIAGHYLKGGA